MKENLNLYHSRTRSDWTASSHPSCASPRLKGTFIRWAQSIPTINPPVRHPGGITNDEIPGAIFRRFCIGKVIA
jgi:hypothetical protein